MSRYIRVTQLNLETPVTTEYANSLQVSAQSIQEIDEQIITFSAVRVTALNLEIPISQAIAEVLNVSQQAFISVDEAAVLNEQPLQNIGLSTFSIDSFDLEILSNSVLNVSSIDEQFIQPEDALVSISTSIQDMLEEIVGVFTPPQPLPGAVPSHFVGAGGKQEDDLYNKMRSEQSLGESITEVVYVSKSGIQEIETLIHEKRVFENSQLVFVARSDNHIETVETFSAPSYNGSEIVSDNPEIERVKRRQKEEDELVLLGILG